MNGGDLTRIRSNIQSVVLLNNLRDVNRSLAIHQLQLGTGKRINSAADDPAGLTQATRLARSSRVMGVLRQNTLQAQDMLGVAEGAMMSINEMLISVQELIETSASDTLNASERQAITQQIIDTVAEIDAVASSAEFNGMTLLDEEKTFNFKTGENTQTSWNTIACDSENLGLDTLTQLTSTTEITSENSDLYFAEVEEAINLVSSGLTGIGSLVNRLQIKGEILEVSQANTEAAYSRIMNADLAETQLELTKDMILQQTAYHALSMSNMNQTSVLNLFNLEMFGNS